MAPPIPVLSREEIQHRYRLVLADPKKYLCKLKSLTQHECTFKSNGQGKPETICLPFKRVFQRCLVADNPKKKTSKWIDIEITDETTNSDLMREERYSDVVTEFLNAEKDMKQWIERGNQ